MKPEKWMWSLLRPYLVRAKLDPVRVENPIHPGTPDVNFVNGWVELKAIKQWPKRPTTIVRLTKYTPSQRVWLYRRWHRGGAAYLLVWVAKTDEWLLFNGDVAAKAAGRVGRADLCKGARVMTGDPGVVVAMLGAGRAQRKEAA